MNKFTRFIGLFFTFTFLFFAFSGCTVLQTNGSGGTGNNQDDPRIDPIENHSGDDNDEPVILGLYDEGYYDGLQELYYGVRAVYAPNTDSDNYANASNAQLNADRTQYNNVVADQFNIISTYILYELIGEYGVATNTEWQHTLDLYADESYLPDDNYDITFYADALTPDIINASTFNTHAGAIEYATNGVNIEIENDTYEFVPNNLTNYAWNCSLGSSHLGDSDYKTQYLNKFVSFLQIRLMETELANLSKLPTGYEILTLSVYNTMSSDEIAEKIGELALLFDNLGVDYTTQRMAEVVSIIENEIIGSSAMNRESASITFHEQYTWIYNELPYFANIDLNDDSIYDETFTSTTLYKYNFDAVVSRIVSEIYDSAGTSVKELPTFDRREIVDDDSTIFFTPGIEGTDTVADRLTNMDYQEYQSAIMYCKTNSIPWVFTLSIDSIEDLEMDIYMRINKSGTIYTCYLGTMHTKSNENYSWTNNYNDEDTPEETEIDYNTLEANTQSWDIVSKICEGQNLPEDSVALPEELNTLFTEGTSTVNVDLLTDPGTYLDISGYKLPIYNDYVSGPSSVKKGNTIADLSNLLVCGNTSNDYIEIIFDTKHDDDILVDKDYRFKFIFQNIDLVAGSNTQE